MSDSDDDLLALAGIGSEGDESDYEPEIQTTKRAGGLKRKIDESEGEQDNDDDDDEYGEQDPYPLEGKYKDDADKAQLLAMDEVTREQIIYDREQEREKYRERRFLALRARQSKAESSAIKASRTTGKSLRTSKLSELKKQRERKNRKESRAYDSDEEDMDANELADEQEGSEDEDAYEEDYEIDDTDTRRKKDTTSDYDDKLYQDATLKDLNAKVRASRTILSRFMFRDEFDEVIRNTYVRETRRKAVPVAEQAVRRVSAGVAGRVEEADRHGVHLGLAVQPVGVRGVPETAGRVGAGAAVCGPGGREVPRAAGHVDEKADGRGHQQDGGKKGGHLCGGDGLGQQGQAAGPAAGGAAGGCGAAGRGACRDADEADRRAGQVRARGPQRAEQNGPDQPAQQEEQRDGHSPGREAERGAPPETDTQQQLQRPVFAAPHQPQDLLLVGPVCAEGDGRRGAARAGARRAPRGVAAQVQVCERRRRRGHRDDRLRRPAAAVAVYKY
ncbi:hypothetical protein KL939_004540 [Ogataea angusta]|nr:hypothetical protein KL939_004540 [Ogataea angusta]